VSTGLARRKRVEVGISREESSLLSGSTLASKGSAAVRKDSRTERLAGESHQSANH